MNKWSLRLKVTFFVGLVILLACVVLTLNSIYSAHAYYAKYLTESGEIMIDNVNQLRAYSAANDTLQSYDILTRDFSIQGIVAMILTIIGAIIITYLGMGRMLRPLTVLTKSIRKIDEENLHQRVVLEGASEEVIQLTLSFNSMLNRLEESFVLQKQFAAHAAHELKTPLTIMKTSLQVLKMDEQPTVEAYEEFTNDIEESIERVINTVEGLLALADESTEISYEKISLRELLNQILRELNGAIKEKNITVNLCNQDKMIKGDATLLFRAFYNLIENAIKYNKPYGTIDIKLNEVGGKCCVEVKDTGVGMSAKNVQSVFQPFYRGNDAKAQGIPGSGLGMSIVKLVIEKCHGSIEIESKEGEGTTVKVYL